MFSWHGSDASPLGGPGAAALGKGGMLSAIGRMVILLQASGQSLIHWSWVLHPWNSWGIWEWCALGLGFNIGEPLVPFFWFYRSRVVATPARGTHCRVQDLSVGQLWWLRQHGSHGMRGTGRYWRCCQRWRCSLGSRGSHTEPLKIEGRMGWEEEIAGERIFKPYVNLVCFL